MNAEKKSPAEIPPPLFVATQAREQLFARYRFAAIGFGDAGLEFFQLFRSECYRGVTLPRDDQHVRSIDERAVVQDDLAGNGSTRGDAHGEMVLRSTEQSGEFVDAALTVRTITCIDRRQQFIHPHQLPVRARRIAGDAACRAQHFMREETLEGIRIVGFADRQARPPART